MPNASLVCWKRPADGAGIRGAFPVNPNSSMNRTPARCAWAAVAFLALTIGANAVAAVVSEDRSAGHGENRPLMMAQAQPSEPGKVFRAVGIVTAIEPAGSLTVNHEPIEGLMPAMEMTFPVNPRALTNGVRPGDRIEFSVAGKTYTIVALKVVGHTE
jgi:Cu/Ag efflux protein CusF